jgi:hypothetical protein
MASLTYSQAIQVARERFTALNNLDMSDFGTFKEYMEVYNTLWEQGMEMMNFAREIEEDMMDLEDECESIASVGDDDDDDASSRNGQC